MGWGTQSFSLAAMAVLGEIEPVDYAIFADTGYESHLTYDFAARWAPWLQEKGLQIITVKNKTKNDPMYLRGGIAIPARNKNGAPLRRQCTRDWKIDPMRVWLQANRHGEIVDQLLGISLDEFQRMRESDVKYVKNIYPLIEKRMSRNDCVNWLERHSLEVPPRSACTFCPFHSRNEWKKVHNTPEDWEQAVQYDRMIRKAQAGYELYLHIDLKPLEEIDYRTDDEKGQPSLFGDECSGVCGI